MKNILVIDGVDYSEKVIVDEITENFILSTGIGTLKLLSDRKKHDVTGTEYSHTLLIRRNPMTDPQEWDDFCELISSPVEYHTVELEHNQGTLIYEAHVTSGGRTLLRREGNKKIWSDLTLIFEPAEPQRRAE